MTKLLSLGVLAVLLLLGSFVSAQNYTEGKHYVRISPKVAPVDNTDAKHEVVELFWYGCPHCYEFEPAINEWKMNKADDVVFVRVPAIFNPRWEQHARAYYALEQMGELEKGHELIFSGLHEQGRALRDVDSMARFLATNGIDEANFRENFNSFAVETKVNRAKELVRDYQITGVPTVIVDGEYKVSASTAGGYDEVIEIIEQFTEE
ncbi:MAG: thiol:disulfide interchange protein DsbA/DsbL [Pseudomonadota bacterium]